MSDREYKIQWEYLNRLFQADKIPQAMIFFGPDFLNKKKIAIEFIKLLNCRHRESGRPCQACQPCLLIEKNHYPDLWLIEPQDGKIGIDKIKEIKKNLSLRPYSSNIKSVVINGAETMAAPAQNSLLKILEEPRGESVFILITSRLAGLLKTIRSRCPVLRFYSKSFYFKGENKFPDIENLMNSDLGKRLIFIKQFFDQKPSSEDVSRFLEIWENYLRMVLLKKAGVEDASLANFSLGSLKECPVSKIKQIINYVEECRRIVSFTNANPRLALESVMLNI